MSNPLDYQKTRIVTFRLMTDHSQKREIRLNYPDIAKAMPRQTFCAFMDTIHKLAKPELGRGAKNWEIVEIAPLRFDGTKGKTRCIRLTEYAG